MINRFNNLKLSADLLLKNTKNMLLLHIIAFVEANNGLNFQMYEVPYGYDNDGDQTWIVDFSNDGQTVSVYYVNKNEIVRVNSSQLELHHLLKVYEVLKEKNT